MPVVPRFVRKRAALRLWLAVAGAALVSVTVILLLSFAGYVGGDGPIGPAVLLGLAAFAVGGLALRAAVAVIARHFDALEALRGDLMAADRHGERMPGRWAEGAAPGDGELGRLASTMGDVLDRHRAERSRPDARLEAVLATVADGLVIAAENGLVVLVNEAAQTLFGRGRIAVGTSLYAALEREDVAEAVAGAVACETPIRATIRTVDGDHLACRVAAMPDHGGIALSVPATVLEPRAGVSHDLRLLDRLPDAAPPRPDTPLAELSASAVDTETTGLDARTDRVLSVGVVRVHGSRVFHGAVLERLVNPGVVVPAGATAVHGLTEAMVAGAPPFAEIVPDLETILADTVILGHNVRFDLAMLTREMREAGREWTAPMALDTALLYMALEPDGESLDLAVLAERYGVAVQGRHTALGDSLVTAEVYVRMLPRLRDKGVETFGDVLDLQRFAMRRTGIPEDPALGTA
jgi:DNA polymerase-3 subunit epsilon